MIWQVVSDTSIQEGFLGTVCGVATIASDDCNRRLVEPLAVLAGHLKGHHFLKQTNKQTNKQANKHECGNLLPPQVQGAPFYLADKTLVFDAYPAPIGPEEWRDQGQSQARTQQILSAPGFHSIMCICLISSMLETVDFINFVQVYRYFGGREFAHLLTWPSLELIRDHGTYRQWNAS